MGLLDAYSLEGAGRYASEDLGPQQLRGGEALIRLYAVSAVLERSPSSQD